MVAPKTISSRIANFIIYLLLALSALTCLLPLLNTVAVSFSDKAAAMSGQVFLWPVNPTLASYRAILEDQQFFRSFWNSIVRVVVGGTVNVVLTILMAYPLSKSPKPSLAHHDLLMTVMTSLWPPSYNQPSPWLPQSPYGHYNLPVATTIQPALPMTTTILLAVTTSLATSIPLWPQCHTVSMATTIPQWPLRPPHGQHSP